MTPSEINKLNSVYAALSKNHVTIYDELLNLGYLHTILDLIGGYRLEYEDGEDPITDVLLFFTDALASGIEKLNSAAEEIEVLLFHDNWPQFAARDDRQKDDR